MAKFHFTITGVFETDSTTQALLQLSHLAEVTKININESFKLDFTDIKVWKEEERVPGQFGHGFGSWGRSWRDPTPVQPQPELNQPVHDILVDDFDNIETTTPVVDKVIPQPWKDKLAGEGMPTD